MDLLNELLESGKKRRKGGLKATLASLVLHGGLIAFVLLMSAQAAQKVAAEDKPIHAFLSSKAAPPPPPPPPPPAASHAASTPKIVKPVQVTPQTFVQPREIPKEIPKVNIPIPTKVAEIDPTPAQPANDPPGAQEGGVPGGVVGGVVGGQQGGTVGGEVGGQIGGVLGGEKGGVVGGTVGGTGDGTGDNPAPPPPPPPPPPTPEPKAEGPLRVGGDVKAPVAINRANPDYTETARKARINGVVIVEAIVNKQGEVEQVKVLKGLPLGLSEEAVEAVKKWRFHPGTLNGEPVEVIFNLTVNFTLQ